MPIPCGIGDLLLGTGKALLYMQDRIACNSVLVDAAQTFIWRAFRCKSPADDTDRASGTGRVVAHSEGSCSILHVAQLKVEITLL